MKVCRCFSFCCVVLYSCLIFFRFLLFLSLGDEIKLLITTTPLGHIFRDAKTDTFVLPVVKFREKAGILRRYWLI